MTESSRESSRESSDTSREGITDDQLPEDLDPEKNPLARDPEDEPAEGAEGSPDATTAAESSPTDEPG